MASIPDQYDHFYSSTEHCYTFPNSDLSGLSAVPTAATGGGGAMWGAQEDFMVPFYGDQNNIGLVVDSNLSPSPAESFMSSSSSSLPEQLGVSDGVVPAISDYSGMMGLHGINGGLQNFGGAGLYGHVKNVPQFVNVNGFDQFVEECCATSFSPGLIKRVGLVSGQNNWGIQSNNQIQANIIEEANMMKVGRYSEEERKQRIVRYLKKRNQRNFNKTIKYACRKTLADRRVRVRGRFARNNEHTCNDDHDQQIIMEAQKNKEINNSTRKDMEFCCNDVVEIKYDEEEDWLQDFALCCWVNGGAN